MVILIMMHATTQPFPQTTAGEYITHVSQCEGVLMPQEIVVSPEESYHPLSYAINSDLRVN